MWRAAARCIFFIHFTGRETLLEAFLAVKVLDKAVNP